MVFVCVFCFVHPEVPIIALRKATVIEKSKNNEMETFEDHNHDMASNEASNEAFECDDCASDLDSVPAEHALELPRGGTN